MKTTCPVRKEAGGQALCQREAPRRRPALPSERRIWPARLRHWLATDSAVGAGAHTTPDIASQTDIRPTKPHNQVGIQGKPGKALSPKRPGRVLSRAAADRRNTTCATIRENSRHSYSAGRSSTPAQLRKTDILAAGSAHPGWRRHWCRPCAQVKFRFCPRVRSSTMRRRFSTRNRILELKSPKMRNSAGFGSAGESLSTLEAF